MKSTVYRKYGLIRVEHVWFADHIYDGRADVTFYHEIHKESISTDNKQYIETPFSTAITDLRKNEDDLWGAIKKNTRYEIRRSEKEGIETKSFIAEEIPAHLLSAFAKTYNSMYMTKGMNNVFNMRLVKRYIENDMIWFSVAFYNGEPLVFHSYIVDPVHARFFYSCSPFREQREMATLIGRMNRCLHWFDMIELKKRGVEEYDWGGISNPDNPNTIDRFKLAFGGENQDLCNVIVGNTIIGRSVLTLKSMHTSRKQV